MAEKEEEKKLDVVERLNYIQQTLKAPKNNTNTFGNYKYRNAEGIFELVKPLLGNGILTINDEIVLIGDRFYIKSTARLAVEDKEIQVSAFAREQGVKKGMDEAQITGSASSYAHKYALGALFCIDDTKDPDATNDHGKNKEGQKVGDNPNDGDVPF